MENFEHVFDQILDQDEKIIKVFKPNKTRFVKINIIFSFIFSFIIIAVGVIIQLMAYIHKYEDYWSLIWVLVVFEAIILLAFCLSSISSIVCYKKVFYGYSNKRLLIRRGFIGVDYRSMDMKMVGTYHVNVGLFDSFIKPNTGLISFASSSSPMVNSSSSFTFLACDNSYELYKEIKQQIDSID